MTYTPSADSTAPTEIRLMKRIHYPAGFDVHYSPRDSAIMKTIQHNENVLQFYSSWQHDVTITIIPKDFVEEQKEKINIFEIIE